MTNSLAVGLNFMSKFCFLKINHTPHLAHLFFTVTEQVRTCKQELRGGAIFPFLQLCGVLIPLKWSHPKAWRPSSDMPRPCAKIMSAAVVSTQLRPSDCKPTNEAHTVLPGERDTGLF